MSCTITTNFKDKMRIEYLILIRLFSETFVRMYKERTFKIRCVNGFLPAENKTKMFCPTQCKTEVLMDRVKCYVTPER